MNQDGNSVSVRTPVLNDLESRLILFFISCDFGKGHDFSEDRCHFVGSFYSEFYVFRSSFISSSLLICACKMKHEFHISEERLPDKY